MIRAIQIRDMNTGIHNLYVLKPKTKAIRVVELFHSLGGPWEEFEFQNIWNEISNFISESVEINFRNYETTPNGNKYFLVNGKKIFVVNQNHIDIW